MTAPDTANNYPSEQLLLAWSEEALGFKPSIASVAIFATLIGKACDWQREQDALTCEEISRERNGWATEALRNGFTLAAQECAHAIRHPQAPNATEGGNNG